MKKLAIAVYALAVFGIGLMVIPSQADQSQQNVYERSQQSVVTIINKMKSPDLHHIPSPYDAMIDKYALAHKIPLDENFFDYGGATGSGFVTDQGVITNAHVIGKDDIPSLTIETKDGRKIKATLVYKDDAADVALLKPDEPLNVPLLTLADSSKVHVGDPVFAIGSPFRLEQSISKGIISNTDRYVYGDDNKHYFQSDAAVNPGNSGGPLFNSEGQVIGINTAIYAPGKEAFAGIAFIIPSNTVKKDLAELAVYGKVRQGLLGVSIIEIDDLLKTTYGLPSTDGALVAAVSKGSAADGKLLRGDVITAFNDIPILNPEALTHLIKNSLGHPNTITIWRAGQQEEMRIDIQEKK